MELITSVQNQKIKTVLELHQKKGRMAQQRFIAHGIRILQGLAASSMQLQELYCTKELLQEALALFPSDSAVTVSETVFKKICPTSTPSGILGVFSIPDSPQPKLLTSGIVLAQVQDPGNTGTLIRSAAAFGYESVVLVEGCDPFNPKVIQSTAGTLGHVQIFQWGWEELLSHKKNLTLCALTLDGDSTPVKGEQILFVVGNEANGIPQAWIDQCDLRMTLAMATGTESLNAAIAGSLALYLGKN